MKALSIRQPWAWMIIRGGKQIENRNWNTKFRGRFLVHAAKGMTQEGYEDARLFAWFAANLVLPGFNFLERGAIIGSVELVDVVQHSQSRWFVGRHGFLLRDPEPLLPVPYKGRLGFFDVPDEVQT